MERIKTSCVHNPTIKYFQKVLAHTIFGHGDSSGNMNANKLYLGNELATLEPILANWPLDINLCLAHKLIKYIGHNEYFLMIRNQEVCSIVLPHPSRIDVWDEANW